MSLAAAKEISADAAVAAVKLFFSSLEEKQKQCLVSEHGFTLLTSGVVETLVHD